MKKLLAIPLMVCAFVLSPMPTSAKPPTPVEFVSAYTVDLNEVEVRTAGPNTFLSGPTATDDWTGDFAGTATQDFVLVNHPVADFNYYSGLITFTGTVLDEEGTLVMKANGKQAGGTLAPSAAQWTGHWVIISGTGDLENLRGQGTFAGPSFLLTFEGKVHFT